MFPVPNPGILIGCWAQSGQRLNEDGLSIGDEMETEKWRVHRYSTSLVLTDLTNAGKRGKKVNQIALYNLDYKTIPAGAIIDDILKLVKSNTSWERVLDAAKKYQTHAGMGIDIRQQRAIDIMPAGFRPIRIDTPNVSVEAGYDGFMVKNRADRYNEPTCIPRATGGKKAIPAFYRWVKENERKIRSMTFPEIQKTMDQLGIVYHYYCAMD